jgi:hypothetical protein
LINRTQVRGKQTVFLVAQCQQSLHEAGEVAFVPEREGRAVEVLQLKVDVEQEFLLILRLRWLAQSG